MMFVPTVAALTRACSVRHSRSDNAAQLGDLLQRTARIRSLIVGTPGRFRRLPGGCGVQRPPASQWRRVLRNPADGGRAVRAVTRAARTGPDRTRPPEPPPT